jgi:hypothetical protein
MIAAAATGGAFGKKPGGPRAGSSFQISRSSSLIANLMLLMCKLTSEVSISYETLTVPSNQYLRPVKQVVDQEYLRQFYPSRIKRRMLFFVTGFPMETLSIEYAALYEHLHL